MVDDLRRKIAIGFYKPGDRLPSLNDLSAEYGVCCRTAMRAMHRLAESGHAVIRPASGASVPDSPPTHSHFGLVFSGGPVSGRWSQMPQAWKLEAERLVRMYERHQTDIRFSFFFNVDRRPPAPDYQRLLDSIARYELAGLVFPEPTPQQLEIFRHPELPRVGVGESHKGLPCLRFEVSLISKGLDFLAAQGCRRVAFLGYMGNAESTWRTLAAETEARGLTTDRHLIQSVDAYRSDWAAHAAELLIQSRDRFDALFVTDDNLLSAATSGLKRAGVNVPKDLFVLGIANFPHVVPVSVPVRLVGIDVRMVLGQAVELLMKQRRGASVPAVTPVRVVLDEEVCDGGHDEGLLTR